MRQSVGGMRQVYDQQRGRYSSLAQQSGFNPDEIVGKPLYDAYQESEANYIRATAGLRATPTHRRKLPPCSDHDRARLWRTAERTNADPERRGLPQPTLLGNEVGPDQVARRHEGVPGSIQFLPRHGLADQGQPRDPPRDCCGTGQEVVQHRTADPEHFGRATGRWAFCRSRSSGYRNAGAARQDRGCRRCAPEQQPF
jgi:hypothetical protein